MSRWCRSSFALVFAAACVGSATVDDPETRDPDPGIEGPGNTPQTPGEDPAEDPGDPNTPNDLLPADPEAPGALTMGKRTGNVKIDNGWLDTNIELQVFTPEGDGPFPVVVFIHGFQLGPGHYASYGRHLASHGFIGVFPKMPGSLFNPDTHVEMRDYTKAIMDWVEDKAETPNAAMRGVADASRIGLAGHSMGGKIAIFTAVSDDRPLGVFGVDPVDAAGGPIPLPENDYPSVTPEKMDKIDVPIAMVGETLNGKSGDGVLDQACAPEDDNFEQYFKHATSPALSIEILDANHMSFLDNPNCGIACSACPKGKDDPAVTRRLTQGYLAAFFKLVLEDDDAYLPYLTGDPVEDDVGAGLVTFETKNGF